MNRVRRVEKQVRLNKYIADSGIASRRNAEEYIQQGRVEVNNKCIIDLGYKVNEETDVVTVDGEKISPKRHVYFLMNKPRGVVTTTSDEKKRETVVDLVKTKDKIFPVGRLDYNTTGILLLTNDGDFANMLTHPKNNIPREYEVLIDRPISEEDLKSLLQGVFIDGVRGVFKKVVFPKRSRAFVIVTAVEGRNHFVKNMFGVLSYNVKTLNRRSFAGVIADIPQGSYRKMSPEEIENIKSKYA